uniref:Sorting nexin N-terminal domain-containing protein n=1 Tax=Theropithecus gelada TaxID=9565 RepID=A0A8D2FMQ1_THEGE
TIQKHNPSPSGDSKFKKLVPDWRDLFTNTVFTLGLSPSALEPANLPAEVISPNFNGARPSEVVLDDDRNLFAKTTEVSLDSLEREPNLSS